MKILLIDDDELVLDLLSESLVNIGHAVVTAMNGREGLERYFEDPNTFNVIITDIKMPEIDGIEFSEKLVFRGSVTPLILMTGHTSTTDEELEKIKFVGLLKKPFEFPELVKLLGEVAA